MTLKSWNSLQTVNQGWQQTKMERNFQNQNLLMLDLFTLMLSTMARSFYICTKKLFKIKPTTAKFLKTFRSRLKLNID